MVELDQEIACLRTIQYWESKSLARYQVSETNFYYQNLYHFQEKIEETVSNNAIVSSYQVVIDEEFIKTCTPKID